MSECQTNFYHCRQSANALILCLSTVDRVAGRSWLNTEVKYRPIGLLLTGH